MDVLFSRKFFENPEFPKESKVKPVSLASYNILADCHSLRSFRENNEYQYTTEDELKIMYRHDRLFEELRYLNADIYCLQEVSPSYFHDVLIPALSKFGYDGIFMKRRGDKYDEGEAIFYQKERFELVERKDVWLKDFAQKELDGTNISGEQKQWILERLDSAAVVVFARLRCKLSGKELTVGSIHVEFGHLIQDDVQCIQIASAIKALLQLSGGPDNPHIIAGDFNSVPTGPGYELASTGSVSGERLSLLESLREIKTSSDQKNSLINLWKDGFCHSSDSLKSSYFTVKKEEPQSSIFPFDSVMRAVDYIWYSSSSLDVQGVLETVPPKHMLPGIPNKVTPSDHVSVKAVFSFK